jgi:hypothetical protein
MRPAARVHLQKQSNSTETEIMENQAGKEKAWIQWLPGLGCGDQPSPSKGHECTNEGIRVHLSRRTLPGLVKIRGRSFWLDGNPNSSLLAKEKIREPPFASQVNLFHTGLGCGRGMSKVLTVFRKYMIHPRICPRVSDEGYASQPNLSGLPDR